MDTEKTLYNMELDQHYFHFIILHNKRRLKLEDYWNHIGWIIKTKNPEKSYRNFEIQHRKLKSKIPYAGGQVLKRISKDGKPPYEYDVFAIRVKTKNDTYIVLAFPFIDLARDSLDKLMSELSVRKGITFRKADIISLILSSDNGIGEELFRAGVVELQVINKKDPNLSSVTLGGDNPLKSSLYEDYLKNPINEERKKIYPERCVLACELQRTTETSVQTMLSKPNIRSRVRMDIVGNFKLYVHKNGENIFIIPHLLRELDAMKYLNRVSINPLLRLSKEEE